MPNVATDSGYGTENVADAVAVWFSNEHVTVWVPVPGVVVETVPYDHDTDPFASAIFVGASPWALLNSPCGSLAFAVQLAPAKLDAATKP